MADVSTRFSTIDLTQLPPPQVTEVPDYQTVYQARITLLQQLWAAFQAQDPSIPELDTLDLNSEPIVIVMQADAYRELLLRGEINDKCRALLLAFATGADLDQIGATYDVARLQVGTDQTTGSPVIEDDDRFRRRIQLAPDAFSSAGPWGAYVFWALTFDASIVDANAVAPAVGGVPNGFVNVYVAAANGQPVADDVISRLLAFYQRADIVPLTDVPAVIHATVVPYNVTLNLLVQRGPDPNVIALAAQTAVQKYAANVYKIGATAYANSIIAAATVGGVLNAAAPGLADVVCDGTQIPWLRSITVNTTVK